MKTAGLALVLLTVLCVSPPSRAYSDEAGGHVARAKSLARSPETFAESIREFELAEAAAPRRGEISYAKGKNVEWYGQAGDMDVALRAFAAARRKGDTHLDINVMETRALWKKGDKPAAADRGIEAIKIYLARLAAERAARNDAEAKQAGGWAQEAADISVRALTETGRPREALDLGLRVLNATAGLSLRQGFNSALFVAGIWAGHEAFAADQYDRALSCYAAAREAQSRYAPADIAGSEWHNNPGNLMEAVRRRKALGRLRPPFVHRVLMLETLETDATVELLQPGTFRKVHETLTPQMHQRLLLNEAVVRRWVEAFSDGNLSVEFVTMPTNAVARPPKKDMWLTDAVFSPGILPYKFANPDFDTFAIRWVPGAVGWPSKTGCYAATDKQDNRRLGPGAQMQIVSDNWLVLLHEFMHVLECNERAFGVHSSAPWANSKIHQRAGHGEADYFASHFGTTLRGKWGRLLFRPRRGR